MQYLHGGVKTALTPAPQPRPGVKQAVDMVARDVSPGLLACQAGTTAPLGTRLEWEGLQGSPSTSLADLHLLPFHSGVQTVLAFLSRLCWGHKAFTRPPFALNVLHFVWLIPTHPFTLASGILPLAP